MINVEARGDHIKVTGHAGCAPPGQDIVCAAVSILVQTLIESVNSLTKDKIEYKLESGKAFIGFKDLSEESKLLMDSFFIGVAAIATEYPEYVSVE